MPIMPIMPIIHNVRKLLLLLTLALLSASIVHAQQAADPCMLPTVAKSTAVISISASATTVSLVAPGANATSAIFVCNASFTISGTTNPTAQLEYGTGATCGTGTTPMTGAYPGGAATAPTPIFIESIQGTPAAQRVCIVTTGTAPTAQGMITFVVQG